MSNSGAREPGDDTASTARVPLSRLALFSVLVLAGNEVGRVLKYPDVGSAVLFLPYAILTAALVVSPRRDWPWYIVAAAAAHLTNWPQWSLSWVLLADVANIVRALTAAMLLTWLFRDRPRIDNLRTLALFVAFAVVLAPAAGAAIGAANVVLHGASDSYIRPWRAWFVSNALTGLTMLPPFIVAFGYVTGIYRWRLERGRVIEAAVMFIALAATSGLVFMTGIGRHHLALLYAPLPVLIWAALRFGAEGAGAALMMVTAAAIWSVDRSLGPFIETSADNNVLMLQLFVLLTTLTVLCLAVVATARQSVVELHNALLSSVQDHVAILDARGIVVEVNESWRRFAHTATHGGIDDARVGKAYLPDSHAGATEHRAAADIRAGLTSVLKGARRRFELEFDDERHGRRVSYAIAIETLERSEGGAVVTRADITARREAEREVEEQHRTLSHLTRVGMLGQLSGAFAHELNQPLTAIRSNAEAALHLLRRQASNPEDLTEILQDIVADDERAAQVIRRLRSLLQRGDRQLQAVDAAALVSDVSALARTELIARRIDLLATVAPGVPPIWGDKVQLQQVLLNLILNGCEAMAGTRGPGRQLVVTASTESKLVQLSVRDFGTGIAPELMGRLFEPFVTTKSDGLGLGLSISRTIVTAHGGRLWAENHADGGATLHFVVPSTASRGITSPAIASVLARYQQS